MKAFRDSSRVMSHGKLKSMVGTHAAGAVKGPVLPDDPAYEKAQQVPSSAPLAKVGKPKAAAFADGGGVLPGDEPPVSRLDRPGRGGKPGATVNVIVAPGPKDAPPPPMPPPGPMPTPPPMPMPPGGGPGGPAPMPPPGGGGAPPMMANRGGRIGLKKGGAVQKKADGGGLKNSLTEAGKVLTPMYTSAATMGASAPVEKKLHQREKAKETDKAESEASGFKRGGGLNPGYSAKDAAAGEDIGKPGKMFGKIASKSGGGEKGDKIAGAILKNLRGG